MKRLTSIIFLLCVGLSMVALDFDFTAENDDGIILYYKVTADDEVSVVHCPSTFKSSDSPNYRGDTLVIPQQVSHDGKSYRVTALTAEYFIQWCDIRKLILPEGLVELGENTLSGAFIEELVLPSTLQKINKYTFSGSKIKSIEIPEGVTSIPERCFSTCLDLESVKLHDNITEIGTGAFGFCTRLKEINLPANITEIRYCTFYECGSLEEIIIPDKVTIIEEYAFDTVMSAKIIKLGTSVQKLEEGAFSFTEKLKDFYVPCIEPPQAPTSAIWIMSKTPQDITLHVPVGTKELYSQATCWSKFPTIVDDITLGVDDVVFDDNADAPIEYYDLRGVRVDNPTSGLYIRRQGSKAEKVMLR